MDDLPTRITINGQTYVKVPTYAAGGVIKGPVGPPLVTGSPDYIIPKAEVRRALAHTTRVEALTDSNRHRATCTCGWSGGEFLGQTTCWEEAEVHKATGDPQEGEPVPALLALIRKTQEREREGKRIYATKVVPYGTSGRYQAHCSCTWYSAAYLKPADAWKRVAKHLAQEHDRHDACDVLYYMHSGIRAVLTSSAEPADFVVRCHYPKHHVGLHGPVKEKAETVEPDSVKGNSEEIPPTPEPVWPRSEPDSQAHRCVRGYIPWEGLREWYGFECSCGDIVKAPTLVKAKASWEAHKEAFFKAISEENMPKITVKRAYTGLKWTCTCGNGTRTRTYPDKKTLQYALAHAREAHEGGWVLEWGA